MKFLKLIQSINLSPELRVSISRPESRSRQGRLPGAKLKEALILKVVQVHGGPLGLVSP